MDKEKLIEKLKQEKERFEQKGLISTFDHDLTIFYLSTGEIKVTNPEDYELLDAAINDLAQLYNDYIS